MISLCNYLQFIEHDSAIVISLQNEIETEAYVDISDD